MQIFCWKQVRAHAQNVYWEVVDAVARILKECLLEALPISAREALKSAHRCPVKKDLHCPIGLHSTLYGDPGIRCSRLALVASRLADA